MKRFDSNERKLHNNVEFPFNFAFNKAYLTEELRRKEENGYIVDFYDNYMGQQTVA